MSDKEIIDKIEDIIIDNTHYWGTDHDIAAIQILDFFKSNNLLVNQEKSGNLFSSPE